MPTFDRYIGIDYSGAKTPTSSLQGLRVYTADRESLPREVLPPPSSRKYWTRRGITEWLVERLAEDRSALVGIDHGFSFPLQYFKTHGRPLNWTAFLDDFQRHWPTEEDNTRVDFVRKGACGNGVARSGNPRWRRLTELRAGAAKSVFHFDVQGSVAKSTHAGLPWLRYIRQHAAERVLFWPFDGWEAPQGRSVVVEVRNQAQGIAAIDMFVAVSASFSLLYVMIILTHDRRKIVRLDVTQHPTAEWLSRQVTEAFPWDTTQCADNPIISPLGILPGHSYNQLLEVRRNSRPARSPTHLRTIELLGHEPTGPGN